MESTPLVDTTHTPQYWMLLCTPVHHKESWHECDLSHDTYTQIEYISLRKTTHTPQTHHTHTTLLDATMYTYSPRRVMARAQIES